MDPVTLSLIVAGMNEAMTLAMQGAQLIKDAHELDLSPAEVRKRWAEISDHYAAARKTWDEADEQETKLT